MLVFRGGKIMQACYHLLAKNIDVSVIFSPPRQVWWKAPSRLEFWEKWWWDCPRWKDQTWCRYTIWIHMEHIPHPSRHLLSRWFVPFFRYCAICSPRFLEGFPTILSDFFFEQHRNCLDWKHMGRLNDNCGAPGAPETSSKQKHHWNDKKESRVVGIPWYNHRPPYIAWTPRYFFGVRKFTAKQIDHDTSCRYMAQLGHQWRWTSEPQRVAEYGALDFSVDSSTHWEFFTNDPGVFLYLVCSTRVFFFGS